LGGGTKQCPPFTGKPRGGGVKQFLDQSEKKGEEEFEKAGTGIKKVASVRAIARLVTGSENRGEPSYLSNNQTEK